MNLRVNRAAVDPRGLNQDGWGEKRGAFLMDYDSDILDASNLLMPPGFLRIAQGPANAKHDRSDSRN